MHVTDAGGLECELRRRHADELRIGLAIAGQAAGKADHRIDLVADSEVRNVTGNCLDDARHVRPRNDRKSDLRLPRWRQHPVPLAQVPIGRIDAHRVDAHEHLTRPQLGNGCVFVQQHLGAPELVQPHSLHRSCRHRISLDVGQECRYSRLV